MKKNYLLSSIFGCLLAVAPVSADVIGMSTATKVGDKLTIALNDNVRATIEWGDGTTENVYFKGAEVELTAKHADFTIKTEDPVTHLYCPDCALTSLDLTNALYLTSLICPDNQLAELDVMANENLEVLNCSGNQIPELKLYKCRKLVYLDVSRNKLSVLSTSSLKELRTLLCSENLLKNKLSMLALTKLETLWCYGNDLNMLSFPEEARPVQLCAFNNQLETIEPANLEGCKTLWLDNNKFKTLVLENAAVEELSVSNNLLTSIVLNKRGDKYLQAFYADGNELMINSLPKVYNPSTEDSIVSYNIDNQRPFFLVDQVNVNEKLSVAEYTRKNGYGNYAKSKTVWKNKNGDLLERNTDYKTSGNDVIFLKGFDAVYGEATSEMYPEVVFKFVPFKVIDPTGIEDVVENNYNVVADDGQLKVTCSQAMTVKVYSVGGALLINAQVSAGTHSWILPAGIYVVNGKKVVLGR